MNKVQLVVTSDVHLHSWKAFATGSGLLNSRLNTTLKALRDSLEEARNRDGVWLCAGDLIHSVGHVRHEVSSPLIDTLLDFPDLTMIIIAGNHDGRSSQGGKVDLHETYLYTLKEAIPNLKVLDNEPFSLPNGPTIWGFPAQPDDALIPPIVEEALGDGDEVGIGLLHGMVRGSDFGTGTFATSGFDPDFLLDYFSISIVGDVHKPTLHRENGRAILVPGSLVANNFGDVGARGYWVVTVEQKNRGWFPVKFEDIESNAPQFITVDKSSEVKDDGNYYRILGSSDEEIPENATAVRPSPTVIETRDILGGAKDHKDILERWLELNEPEGRFASRYLKRGLDILKRQEEIVPRNAKVKHVEGENFFSYESLEYDVSHGVHLIVGQSKDFDSNGAGKSTLLELVAWTLFNKTTKGVSAADVIRWGESSCRGYVEIELDGKPLIVERSRTSSGVDLNVKYDGEQITGANVTDLSKRLEGVLGLTFDLFKALGYFSQEDLLVLPRSTDAELKKTLADLRGLTAYQSGAEEAGQLAREAESEANKYATKVETLSEEIERDTRYLAEQKTEIDTWDKKHETQVRELEEKVKTLEDQHSSRMVEHEERTLRVEVRAENLQTQADARASEVRAVQRRSYMEELITGIEEKRSSVENKLQEIREELGEERAGLDVESVSSVKRLKESKFTNLRDEVSDLKSQIQTVDSNKKNIESQLEKEKDHFKQVHESVANDTCPTCGQTLVSRDSVNTIKEEILDVINKYTEELDKYTEQAASLRHKLAQKQQALQAAKDDVEQVQGLLELVTKRIKLEESLQNLSEKEANAEEVADAKAAKDADAWLHSRQRRIEKRVDSVKAASKRRVDEVQVELQSATRDLKSERETNNPYRLSSQRIEESQEERRSERWRAQRRHLECRVNQKIYSYWQSAFSKSGIQSLLLEDFAALFNKHRGRIFPLLTRGKYDVQFSAVSTTQSGELREKAEYRIFRYGEEIPYANLSGGQRRRVDLGVLLTTTLAASEAHGVPGALGVMFLDEVSSYLDEDGAEALAETLEEICPSVVPSVYVVSQDMAHKALYDDVIVVTQNENGVSRVEAN